MIFLMIIEQYSSLGHFNCWICGLKKHIKFDEYVRICSIYFYLINQAPICNLADRRLFAVNTKFIRQWGAFVILEK